MHHQYTIVHFVKHMSLIYHRAIAMTLMHSPAKGVVIVLLVVTNEIKSISPFSWTTVESAPLSDFSWFPVKHTWPKPTTDVLGHRESLLIVDRAVEK